MNTITLFFNALKVGYLAYGGGGTMIVLVHRLFVETGYLSEDVFSRMVGTIFLVPGPFGINMGALTGLEIYGLKGVTVMVLGIIAPSFTLMPLMWKIMEHMPETRWTIGFKKSTKVLGWALSFFAALLILKSLMSHVGKSMVGIVALYSTVWLWIMHKYRVHPAWFMGTTIVVGIILGSVGII